MTLLEARRCTPVEFQIYNKAHLIQMEEKTRMLALQAWLNQSVQATKKSGKKQVPAYKKFDEFYNADKHFNNLFEVSSRKVKPKILTLADKNRILSQSSKEGGN